MIVDKSKLSPMMRRYFEIKSNYEDCLLFFRLGDFYEMFFDDAERRQEFWTSLSRDATADSKIRVRLCAAFLTTPSTTMYANLSTRASALRYASS